MIFFYFFEVPKIDKLAHCAFEIDFKRGKHPTIHQLGQ